MTLRSLATARNLEQGLTPPTELSRNTGLVFAFDTTYLAPFKTCAYSLIAQRSLLDSPITIYSTDPAVRDDPVVQACAERVVLLDGARRDLLERLARDHVKRPERADWNRGTFLKWAIFEPQPTERVLFMDVDMIALQPLDPLLAGHGRADFSCCPQFQRDINLDSGQRRENAAIVTTLKDMIGGRFSDSHRWRVNSGLLSLSAKICSADFFEEISAHALGGLEINEQSFFSTYFKQHREALHMLSLIHI